MMRPLFACLALLCATPALAQASPTAESNSPQASTAVESGHVWKASAALVYSVRAVAGASAGFVMVFDSTTVPADGAVTPKLCFSVPATSTIAHSFAEAPLYLPTGFSIAFSLTGCFTKTASATAFFSVDFR